MNSTLYRNRLIVITGSTGVGKTAFAENLIHYFPIEIINCDVGQFYKPLSIGTAKPPWKASKIPHHFFDIELAPRNVTVIEFRQKLEQLVYEIFNRGAIPVIVGGSTLYIHSIFFAHHPTNEEIKKVSGTWDELFTIDPERAKKIHPHDSYRINRALSIWHSSQQKPSGFTPHFAPLSPFSLLFLGRPRHNLYEKINQRVIQMFDQGWLDEANALRGSSWESFVRIKKFIGYTELFDYGNETASEEKKAKIIALIQQKTRSYAKKQETFWRMVANKIERQLHDGHYQDSHLDFIDLTLPDHDLYIKQLLKRIKGA